MDAKTTGQKINLLAPGKFLKLGRVIPSGTLEARKLSSGGVTLYWRFTFGGKASRESIGIYDPSAPPKSLQATGRCCINHPEAELPQTSDGFTQQRPSGVCPER